MDSKEKGEILKLINSRGGGGGSATWGSITGTLSSQTDLQSALNGKQATLVSGSNIKTVNGNSIVGSGNVVVSGADKDFAVVAKWTAPSGDTSNTVQMTWSLLSLNSYMRNIYSQRTSTGSWSATASGVSVPHDGYVIAKASVYFAASGGAFPHSRNGLYIFTNGVEVGSVFQGLDVGGYAFATYPFEVHAGDLIEIKARSDVKNNSTMYACLDNRCSYLCIQYF